MSDPRSNLHAIIGTREGADNAVIVGAWADAIGRAFPEMTAYAHNMRDATAQAWCGFCQGYVHALAGIRPPFVAGSDTKNFMWAAAWKDWGTPVDHAQPGDVLVLNHHVTLCDGEDGDYYLGLGGNQSDQVKVSRYAKSAVLAIRRAPAPSVSAPAQPLVPLSTARRCTGITATMFADASVAYGDVKAGWNDRPGVALPYRFPKGPRPRVRVWRAGRSVDCDVVDVGPWNIDDPYWLSGARPQAEGGTDTRGRTTNHAGIDLTPAADAAIGLNGKGVVDWEIIQEPVMPDTSTPSPMPVQPPVVVTTTQAPAPTTNQSIRNWVHTAFYGVLTAIAGVVGIQLPATLKPASPALDQVTINNVVAAAVNPQSAGLLLKDPNLKAAVDIALLQAIQSGVPGQLIQGGAGLIPGAAPFAATLEPILRKIIIDVMEQKQTQQQQAPAAAAKKK